jgi:hypothetical protein
MPYDDDDDPAELTDLLPLTCRPLRDELRRPWWLDDSFADLDRLTEDMEDE